jgi:hypothetical protein
MNTTEDTRASYRRKENTDKRQGRKARFMSETAIPTPPARIAQTFAQPPPRRELHTFGSLREIYLIPRSTAYSLIGKGCSKWSRSATEVTSPIPPSRH